MSNRKRIIFLCCIIMLGLLGLVGCSVYDKKEYCGNGISYIITDDKKSILLVYNENGVYTKQLGTKEEYFWFASSIYDNETLAVDNNDVIYCLTENSMETYADIADNIMAVLNANNGYMVLSQDKDNVYIEMYDKTFSDKLDTQKVVGSFDNCYLVDDRLFISVHGDESEFTTVYLYNTEEKILDEIYVSDYAEEIYVFEYDKEVFLIKNKRITDLGNIDVMEIYFLGQDGIIEKIIELEQPVEKVLIVDEEVYALCGVNSTSVMKLDLKEYKQDVLFELEEEALGICKMEEQLYVLTGNAIYAIEDNKLIKKQDIDSFGLMNVFY